MNMKAHAFSTTIITFSLLSITITIVYVCAYAIFAHLLLKVFLIC